MGESWLPRLRVVASSQSFAGCLEVGVGKQGVLLLPHWLVGAGLCIYFPVPPPSPILGFCYELWMDSWLICPEDILQSVVVSKVNSLVFVLKRPLRGQGLTEGVWALQVSLAPCLSTLFFSGITADGS